MSQLSGIDSRAEMVDSDGGQSSAMTVDPLLMSRIRTRLAALGLPVGPAIVLFDLTADALHVAAVDAATGEVAVHLRDRAISAAALDRGLADYLVAEGALARPTTRAWARELVSLVGAARRRLVERSSTSVAGSAAVGVVRVDRDAVDAAFAPLVARAERLGDRAAVASPLDVTSAVLTADQPWWPGLSAGLAAVYDVPVVTIGQPAAVITDPQRDGNRGTATDVADPVSHPGPMTGDHDRVAMPLALAYSEVPGSGVDVDSAVTDELDVRAVVEQLDTDRFVPIDLVDTDMFDEPQLDPQQRAERRKHNRNVLLGAAAAAAVMVGGAVAITSPSWSGDRVNHSAVDQASVDAAEQPAQAPVAQTTKSPILSIAPDTVGATAPVVQFTPAPPKPAAPSNPGRGRGPGVNLVPGLPPIPIPIPPIVLPQIPIP